MITMMTSTTLTARESLNFLPSSPYIALEKLRAGEPSSRQAPTTSGTQTSPITSGGNRTPVASCSLVLHAADLRDLTRGVNRKLSLPLSTDVLRRSWALWQCFTGPDPTSVSPLGKKTVAVIMYLPQTRQMLVLTGPYLTRSR
jgi:hypothetical protein